MPTTDPRIDAYIAKSADFAKAILTHVRALVHEACPDVVETMKWGNPSFDHQGLLCSMGAFKTHCTVGFWKGELLGLTREEGSMGHFGRITSMTDLPAKSTFVKLVKQAAKLNEAGVKVAQPARIPRAELPVPNDLMGALKKNKKAMTAFQSFPPSHRREYIEWITEAKREETRQKRLTVATLVRKELPQIAPSAIVDSVATLDGMVARHCAMAIHVLAVVGSRSRGVLLTSVGLIGSVSPEVTNRRRELALRLALGAHRRDVLRSAAQPAAWSSGLGILTGILVAIATARAMRGLLFHVEPLDPATWVGVIGFVIAAVGFATYVPARRAAAFDPAVLLRE